MCGIELHDRKLQRNVNGQGIEKCKENIQKKALTKSVPTCVFSTSSLAFFLCYSHLIL